ncbi:MAG TPA: nucleotide-binding protein [Polyangiaceae bacterium]|nr:nucleotide-binding protein [Polyangiaceae bacterium]
MVELSDSLAPQEETALNAMVDLIMRSDNPEVLCRDVRKRLDGSLEHQRALIDALTHRGLAVSSGQYPNDYCCPTLEGVLRSHQRDRARASIGEILRFINQKVRDEDNVGRFTWQQLVAGGIAGVDDTADSLRWTVQLLAISSLAPYGSSTRDEERWYWRMPSDVEQLATVKTVDDLVALREQQREEVLQQGSSRLQPNEVARRVLGVFRALYDENPGLDVALAPGHGRFRALGISNKATRQALERLDDRGLVRRMARRGFVVTADGIRTAESAALMARELPVDDGRQISGTESEAAVGKKVFIVHGHNHTIRDQIDLFLSKELRLETRIMQDEPNGGRTLPEKFEDVADECGFAVFILSADDQLTDSSGKRVLRARQNVILEVGFFWGKLGRRHKLAVLVEHADQIELPSDMTGLAWIGITPDLALTKEKLRKELAAAGLI